jgi:hypothetical protein
MSDDNIFGEMIYSYTRAQAIEDGVLIDVSEVAKEAGIKIPVAVTEAVWDQYVEWTDEDTKKQTSQDQFGSRLWDILFMLYLAIKNGKNESSSIDFKLNIILRDGRSNMPVLVTLKSIISSSDNGEPVVTIMLPNED